MQIYFFNLKIFFFLKCLFSLLFILLRCARYSVFLPILHYAHSINRIFCLVFYGRFGFKSFRISQVRSMLLCDILCKYIKLVFEHNSISPSLLTRFVPIRCVAIVLSFQNNIFCTNFVVCFFLPIVCHCIVLIYFCISFYCSNFFLMKSFYSVDIYYHVFFYIISTPLIEGLFLFFRDVKQHTFSI